MPSSWGGGIHAYDLYAEGTIALGIGGIETVRMNRDGYAEKPGGGAWAAPSDMRLKKNVAPLQKSLSRLLSLRGVQFEFIDPRRGMGVQNGFIAQEVEKVMPDWVADQPDGYKAVGVKGFEALSVEAFRELNDRVVALEKELASLKNRLPERNERVR
jgi:uncharacterized small protein (DUF1192 family)